MDETATKDLAAQYAKLAAAATNAAGCQEFMRFTRLNRVGAPALTLAVGRKCRTSYGSTLGDEYWTVLEQTAVAALACSDVDEAKTCLAALRDQFPGSQRVERVRLQIVEAEGDLTAADKGYGELMDATPTDAAAQRRRVAVLKARGDTREVVTRLSKYLETFAGDADAWLELSEAHVSGGRLQQAHFCIEEHILLTPNAPALHVRAAQLLAAAAMYTSGGGSADLLQLRQARLHAAEAVRLTGRALALPLVVLADVCYAHWAAANGHSAIKPLAQLGPAKTLADQAAAAVVWASGAASSGEGSAASSGTDSRSSSSSSSSKASAAALSKPDVAEAVQQDVELHAVCVARLAALAAGSAAAQAAAAAKITAQGASVTAAEIFPELALEAQCLSSTTAAVLQTQSKVMATAAAASGSTGTSGSGTGTAGGAAASSGAGAAAGVRERKKGEDSAQ